MNLFTTKGRARRMEYFLHAFIGELIFISIAAALIFALAYANPPLYVIISVGVIIAIGFLISLWSNIAIGIRRLHDLDKSGSHFWGFFVPFYNIYLGLIMAFRRGSIGSNKYGNDPRTKVTQGKAAAESDPRETTDLVRKMPS